MSAFQSQLWLQCQLGAALQLEPTPGAQLPHWVDTTGAGRLWQQLTGKPLSSTSCSLKELINAAGRLGCVLSARLDAAGAKASISAGSTAALCDGPPRVVLLLRKSLDYVLGVMATLAAG